MLFTYEKLTMTIDQTKLLQLTNCKSPMPGTIYSTASSGLLKIDKILQQMLWKLSSPSPVKKKKLERSPQQTLCAFLQSSSSKDEDFERIRLALQ